MTGSVSEPEVVSAADFYADALPELGWLMLGDFGPNFGYSSQVWSKGDDAVRLDLYAQPTYIIQFRSCPPLDPLICTPDWEYEEACLENFGDEGAYVNPDDVRCTIAGFND